VNHRSRSTRRARVATVPIVVAALFAVAACSTKSEPKPDASKPELQQIQDATVAAGSAKYSGEIRFAAGDTGAITGITQADPPAGDVTFPYSTPTGTQEVEVVWVNDTLWIRRATTPDQNAVSAFLRLDTDLPWVQAPYASYGRISVAAYDPYALLDRLVAGDVTAVPDGTETVDGRSLDRYTIDLSGDPVAPGGARSAVLDTDSNQRLAAVRLEGPDTISYTLSDYGVDVSPTPPSADQVSSGGARPTVVPTGPFAPVAQGVSNEVSWQLLRAPGSDDGTCWRLDTSQPLDPVAATQGDGSTCVAAVEPTAPVDEQVQIVADAGAGATYDALVALVPVGSQARLQFSDRSSQDLTVDPGGFVVWFGPKSPLAVVLQVTAPDGSQTSCGPGAVSELDDLDSLDPSAVAQLDRAPWLCIA
jgi:hypothetical protein